MRKHVLILSFLTLSLVSCSPKTSHPASDSTNLSTNHTTYNPSKILDYPSTMELVSVRYEKEEVNSITELGKAIDYLIFNSSEDTYLKKTPIKITDSFKQELQDNLKETILSAAYSGSLSQNFFHQYDASDLSDNILYVYAGFTPDFATIETEFKPAKNSANIRYFLSPNHHSDFTVRTLPLAFHHKGYVPVKNSEALFFALEEGYFPYATDKAEELLLQAISVLNEIATPQMKDLELYENIFSYVIHQIQYDYETAKNTANQVKQNQAFFLEGAFNGHAVCDGISKEIVVLSRLMGLECYHAGAQGNEAGHAYNYIKIDDQYYLSCPTSAICHYPLRDNTFQSYHCYSTFLTDVDTNNSLRWPYDSYSHIEIKPFLTKEFDYWRYASILIDGQEYSLNVTDKETALKILRSVSSLSKAKHLNLEIELNGSYSILMAAVNELKQEGNDVIPLNTGTFQAQRLYCFQFLGE